MNPAILGTLPAATRNLIVSDNLPNTLHGRTESRNEVYTDRLSNCIQFLCLTKIVKGNPKGMPLIITVYVLQEITLGNSLAVQWLGLRAFTAGARVPSLVGELRCRKQHGAAINK